MHRSAFPHIAFLMLCVLALLAGSAAHADLTKDARKVDKKEKVIPEAKEATIRFAAGQPVVIELAAAVGSLGHVEFMIRDLPEHGTLSAIKPHPKENNKSIVTYTHRLGAPLADRFSFACRLEDGPSSVAAAVTLIGKIIEPKLEIKQIPRIGRVMLGGEVTGKVSVKNTGGAPFSGEIKWPAPWTGPPRLSIKAGETQDFIIALRPVQPGTFKLDMELQPGQAASKLMVYGESSRVLSVTPGDLTLALNAKTGAREGVLTVVNTESDPLVVGLKYPPRLSGPQQVELLPRERREVTLVLPSTDAQAFRGDVEIIAGREVERVVIQASPKPGELLLVKPGKPAIDLGRINEKEKAAADIVVRNQGGQELIVEAGSNPPVTLDGGNAIFRLGPMQEKSLTFTLSGARLGAFSGDIKLTAGSAVIPIVVKAEIIETPQPASPTIVTPAPIYSKNNPAKIASETDTLPRMPNETQQLLIGVLATEGLPPPPDTINPDLERVESAELLMRTRNSISFAWKKPNIPPASWLIEFANYVRNPATGIFSKDWKVCSTATMIEVKNDKVGFKIDSLKPNTIYEARVMAVDREGKVSMPSPVFQLVTADTWHFPSWLLWLFMLILLCSVLYVLYRLRRGDFPAFA